MHGRTTSSPLPGYVAGSAAPVRWDGGVPHVRCSSSMVVWPLSLELIGMTAAQE